VLFKCLSFCPLNSRGFFLGLLESPSFEIHRFTIAVARTGLSTGVHLRLKASLLVLAVAPGRRPLHVAEFLLLLPDSYEFLVISFDRRVFPIPFLTTIFSVHRRPKQATIRFCPSLFPSSAVSFDKIFNMVHVFVVLPSFAETTHVRAYGFLPSAAGLTRLVPGNPPFFQAGAFLPTLFDSLFRCSTRPQSPSSSLPLAPLGLRTTSLFSFHSVIDRTKLFPSDSADRRHCHLPATRGRSRIQPACNGDSPSRFRGDRPPKLWNSTCSSGCSLSYTIAPEILGCRCQASSFYVTTAVLLAGRFGITTATWPPVGSPVFSPAIFPP